MPTILGADPDKETPGWVDDWDKETASPRASGWQFNPQVSSLVSYFGYHPKMSMSQRFDERDRAMVAGWVARKTRAGFNPDQIKKAIDRFFLSYASEYSQPAPALVSSGMQDRIFEGDSSHHSHPILEWIGKGMPDDGPFVDPRGMRSLLLLRCHEGLLRYPEVVVSILDTVGRKRDLLAALEYIIRWNLGKEESVEELVLSQKILANFDLPSELRSKVKSKIREASPTTTRSIERMQQSKRYRLGKRTD
jgi:hypothetical protein